MNADLAEIERWAPLHPPGQPSIVVLVIDDSVDDEVTHAVAEEGVVPSERFGGVWGNGQRYGNWLVGFMPIELGGGLERQWFTDNIHRELLEAVLEVPHLVALLPAELAGDFKTGDDLLPRLGGALFVQVDERSPQVAKILAESDD